VEIARSLVPGQKSSVSHNNEETQQAKQTKFEYLFKQSECILKEITQALQKCGGRNNHYESENESQYKLVDSIHDPS